MDLKVVRFIREASPSQLSDIALVFIQRHPEEALELMAEVPEPGVDITPNDVPSLPRAIFLSESVVAELQMLYRGNHGGDNKIAVIKQIRTIFGYGLKEGVDITEFLIRNKHISLTDGPAVPPRF